MKSQSKHSHQLPTMEAFASAMDEAIVRIKKNFDDIQLRQEISLQAQIKPIVTHFSAVMALEAIKEILKVGALSKILMNQVRYNPWLKLSNYVKWVFAILYAKSVHENAEFCYNRFDRNLSRLKIPPTFVDVTKLVALATLQGREAVLFQPNGQYATEECYRQATIALHYPQTQGLLLSDDEIIQQAVEQYDGSSRARHKLGRYFAEAMREKLAKAGKLAVAPLTHLEDSVLFIDGTILAGGWAQGAVQSLVDVFDCICQNQLKWWDQRNQSPKFQKRIDQTVQKKRMTSTTDKRDNFSYMIAQRLLSSGCELQFIVDTTGLSIEEVNMLKAQQK